MTKEEFLSEFTGEPREITARISYCHGKGDPAFPVLDGMYKCEARFDAAIDSATGEPIGSRRRSFSASRIYITSRRERLTASLSVRRSRRRTQASIPTSLRGSLMRRWTSRGFIRRRISPASPYCPTATF